MIYCIELQKLGLCYIQTHFIRQFQFCSHVILDYICEQLYVKNFIILAIKANANLICLMIFQLSQ